MAEGYILLVEVSQLSQRTMLWLSDDDMIEHVNFHQLPGADYVARHFNISFARRFLA